MYCVEIPVLSADKAATDAWLDDNVLGHVVSYIAGWSDVIEGRSNRAGGLWNYYGGKPAPGTKHHGQEWTSEQLHEKSFVVWKFEKRAEGQAFRKRFGGEYSVR